jgi:hypothetical protein
MLYWHARDVWINKLELCFFAIGLKYSMKYVLVLAAFFLGLSMCHLRDLTAFVTRVIWGLKSHKFVWSTNLCDSGYVLTQIHIKDKTDRYPN